MTGTISVNKEAVPFKALLTDATEDPQLLGRPCVMTLAADGSRPLKLKICYDATKEIPVTEMLASFRDTNGIPLRAGKPEKACLRGVLNDLSWHSQLILVENRIQGHLELNSQLDQLNFSATDDVRPEIVQAANEAFGSLQTLNATVQISGTLRKPDIELNSDVGEQVATGVKTAFTHQLEIAKAKLIEEVGEYADEHMQTLKNRFAAEYGQLLQENADLIAKATEVKTIVASLQSGNIDARSFVKQVSSSSLIKDKDREKINSTVEKLDSALSGQLPPELQKKIPTLPGNAAFNTGSLRSLLPPRLQQPRAKD